MAGALPDGGAGVALKLGARPPAFGREVRRIIYTTNAIESLNFTLRKVTKARGMALTQKSGEVRALRSPRRFSDSQVGAGRIVGKSVPDG